MNDLHTGIKSNKVLKSQVSIQNGIMQGSQTFLEKGVIFER
jgi:hypothetical protein